MRLDPLPRTNKAAHVVPVLLLSTLAALTTDTWATERAVVDAARTGTVATVPLAKRLPARLTAATAAVIGLAVPDSDGQQSMAACAQWARRGLRHLAQSLSISASASCGPVEPERTPWSVLAHAADDPRLVACAIRAQKRRGTTHQAEWQPDRGRAPPRA